MRPLLKMYAIEVRQTIVLALPIIASQVGQILLHVTDTAIIGRLGTVPLAAAALSTSLFSFFLIFGLSAGSFVSTLVAQAYGAQKNKHCGEILRHGTMMNFLLGVAIALSIHLFVFLFPKLDQPPEIIEQATPFFLILGWSAVPALVFHSFRQFSEGLNQTVIPMLVTLATLIINLFLNWVLVFGNLGFPRFELFGSGIATLLARTFMMLAMMFFVIRGTRFISYLPQRWTAPINWALIRQGLSVAIPTGLQGLFEVGAFSAAAVMMGWIGTSALAAHQIALNLASITFMFVLGMSFAANIRVGQAFGRGDIVAARRIGFGAVGIGLAFMFICAVIFIVGRDLLPRIYVREEEVIRLASELILIGGLFQIFDGTQGILIGALRGLTDLKIPTIINFVAYWLFGLPLGYLLAFKANMAGQGVWTALLIALIIASILLSYRFYRSTSPILRPR